MALAPRLKSLAESAWGKVVAIFSSPSTTQPPASIAETASTTEESEPLSRLELETYDMLKDLVYFGCLCIAASIVGWLLGCALYYVFGD